MAASCVDLRCLSFFVFCVYWCSCTMEVEKFSLQDYIAGEWKVYKTLVGTSGSFDSVINASYVFKHSAVEDHVVEGEYVEYSDDGSVSSSLMQRFEFEADERSGLLLSSFPDQEAFGKLYKFGFVPYGHGAVTSRGIYGDQGTYQFIVVAEDKFIFNFFGESQQLVHSLHAYKDTSNDGPGFFAHLVPILFLVFMLVLNVWLKVMAFNLCLTVSHKSFYRRKPKSSEHCPEKIE